MVSTTAAHVKTHPRHHVSQLLVRSEIADILTGVSQDIRITSERALYGLVLRL